MTDTTTAPDLDAATDAATEQAPDLDALAAAQAEREQQIAHFQATLHHLQVIGQQHTGPEHYRIAAGLTEIIGSPLAAQIDPGQVARMATAADLHIKLADVAARIHVGNIGRGPNSNAWAEALYPRTAALTAGLEPTSPA